MDAFDTTDTRYYIELIDVDHNTVCNWSQLERPTLPLLKAMARSAAFLEPIRMSAVFIASGPYVDGFKCTSIRYSLRDAATGEKLQLWLNVERRPNDPAYTDEFGKRCPEWTVEERERYGELFLEYAPARHR